MVRDFVIYHVPSLQKVGCTRNFRKSLRERYAGRDVFILETIPASKGPKYAGDIEWDYAVKFGYKRSNHYLNTWDFKLSKEQRQSFAAKSYIVGLAHQNHSANGSWRGLKGFARMDANKAQHISKRAAQVSIRSPNHPNNVTLTCPHCGKEGNIGNMQRWHFDNCRSTNGR